MSVKSCKMDCSKAVSESVTKMGLRPLKVKQREALHSFVEGHDTFVSLPTGYGKSVIYGMLPFVFDKLRG